MTKLRKQSTELRDILNINSYIESENTAVIGMPDFITVEGNDFYLKHSTARNTEGHYCQQCTARPSSGFWVELESHSKFGDNLAAYQCDNCKMIQILRATLKQSP